MQKSVLVKTLHSLALGAVGGALFFALDLPLAWMLGSMCFMTFFAIRGLDLTVYPPLRQVMTAVLGVMLGSSFSTETIEKISIWSNGLLLLFICVILSMMVTYFYFRKIGHFDRVTAYFSSAPGGFNVMYEVGEEKGGDGRKIALIHATRVLLLVMVVPLTFRFTVDVTQNSEELSLFGKWEEIDEYFWLLLAAIAGYFGGKLIKLPAYHLMGPLIVAAILEMTGFVSVKPPMILVYAAQLVIGTAIGLRFLGTTVQEVKNVILLSIGSTGLMMIISAVLAVIFTTFVGISVPGLILALSPGGLAEMSLVALALGIDVAFVSVMHVIRIAAIIALVPLFYPVFEKFRPVKAD